MIQATPLEHRPRSRRQSRAVDDLERMQHRGRPELEEDVPYALLGHVERLLGVEDSPVERDKSVDVRRQERNVVNALDETHSPLLQHDRLTGRPAPPLKAIAPTAESTATPIGAKRWPLQLRSSASMVWRFVVATLFVIGEAALVAADFSAEDDPWATILSLGLPVVVGMLIGKWWALAVAATPLLLYAIDPDVVGDLTPWFALSASILINAGCLALGVASRRSLQKARATQT